MQRPCQNKNCQLPAFHNSLNAYALSAAAAGVALLAAAAPADAEIVFTPVNGTIAPGSKYQLDLNNDGVIDFTIENNLHLSTTPFGDDLNIFPAKGNAVWQGSREPFNQITAAALPAGVPVGTGKPFVFKNANMAYASLGAGSPSYVSGGPWKSATDRFLGLRFIIDGEVHFGWARLTVIAKSHDEAVHATITGYAYETEANTPILTGKISGPTEKLGMHQGENNPRANLGVLALGAPGLSLWRRKEES